MHVENFESEHLQVGLCSEILKVPPFTRSLLYPFRNSYLALKGIWDFDPAAYEMN